MDGHYSLDLSHQMDKFCLNKLLEVGMTIAFRRAKKRYAIVCVCKGCVVVRYMYAPECLRTCVLV